MEKEQANKETANEKTARILGEVSLLIGLLVLGTTFYLAAFPWSIVVVVVGVLFFSIGAGILMLLARKRKTGRE